MKKTYLIPTTIVVKVELQNIIAASLTGLGANGGTTTLTEEVADSGTDSWSRGGGYWDDED